MVVALCPGKFYGSSLPRPRIDTDTKYNSYRIHPPVSVTDPLMSWAEEAHWSIGGLSFQRHRLQGRIEGNVEKLRNQIEKILKKKESLSPKLPKKKFVSKSLEKSSKRKKEVDRNRSPSLPPAPLADKRNRRYVGSVVKKWPVRKLSDEFDLVANAKKSDGESEVKTVSKGKKRLRKVGEPRVSL